MPSLKKGAKTNDFEKRLLEYFAEVSRANTEPAKAFLFLEFVRGVFKKVNIDHLERLYPQLEKYIKVKKGAIVVAGRIDALLGNLIIEFETKLSKEKLEEAKEQLKKYTAILWSGKRHRTPWVNIASDGMNFCVYIPKTSILPGMSIESKDVILEEIDTCNLKDVYNALGPERVYVWLDRYILYKTLTLPITEEFVNDFSSASPTCKASMILLKDAWAKTKRKGGVALFDEWGKYLEIVYGSKVETEDLFLRHTYLATLAKFMAYMFYSRGMIPSASRAEKIISGEAFAEWGIYGFLEEDFFSWINRKDIKELCLKFVIHLLEKLEKYDLTKLEEDVLKGVYQELVDPAERHDLGEYYTPEWLAEMIVEEALKKSPEKKLLDPACGSGTFLAAAVRFKKKHLKGWASEKLLESILASVTGIDIHPLAIIISKINYLLSLGDLLKDRIGGVTIPVYMANSIKLPSEIATYSEGLPVHVVNAPTGNFMIPTVMTEHPDVYDNVIDSIRSYVKRGKKELEYEGFKNFILRVEKLQRLSGRLDIIIKTLFDNAVLMWRLLEEGKDTIWSFILKNLFKPLFLHIRDEKFDVIIGNPPWLSYRFVKNPDYQREVKDGIIYQYRLLPSENVALITQMEIATLFFAGAAALYLKDGGTIAFVMPRSVFTGDQHDNFRRGGYLPNLHFEKIIDLLQVNPLFKVPSCVIVARKGKKTKYPISTLWLSGQLRQKNTKLNEAYRVLERRWGKLFLCEMGMRSFLAEEPLKISAEKSSYYGYIDQGATIVPGPLWLVDLVPHPQLGINVRVPFVRSAEKAKKLAEEPYRTIALEGSIEATFLYGVLTGSEIVPFCCLEPNVAVIPIEPSGKEYHIISEGEAKRRGDISLSAWLKSAEREWGKRRGAKAKRITAVEWLNYRNKLVRQNPQAKYRVIYNTSGTYLVSAVVKNTKPVIKVNNFNIKLSGIVIGHTLYGYETSSEDEAHYLSAVLNSTIIDSTIKPAQARGLFGPRHICKKPFEFPIPNFNPKKSLHTKLSTLGKKCAKKVKEQLHILAKKYRSIGKIRRELKEVLKEEIREIDELTMQLLKSSIKPLEAF